MIDINLIRTNPGLVKSNMKRKFRDKQTYLVDEVKELDIKYRDLKQLADTKRNTKNTISKSIGVLMREGNSVLAEEKKKQVNQINEELIAIENEEKKTAALIKERMMQIPNIMEDKVPEGLDDSANVEIAKYGKAIKPDYEIPYHVDILESLSGVDLESSRRVAGHGFYYLEGDVARLHSAILTYARDFMIDQGFKYVIPPYMIRSDIVTGVMSFAEMDDMMYKIEGEDLYLIGTSEHSMIGKFKDQILNKENLPYKMTSYSPCFRKEKGAHGIEERGIYRVHQFEKQEMIILCEPSESKEWFEKLYETTIEFFKTLELPIRSLEICSGDLTDLKSRSIDIEAWSPRQQKYFEVGSCSNLTDAQSRRLNIRVKGTPNYYPHTLNNTLVAPPRMLIAFLENHYQKCGNIKIPKALRPYMGGKTHIKNQKK